MSLKIISPLEWFSNSAAWFSLQLKSFLILAKALANLASNHSMDSNFDSPYSLEARSKVQSFFRYNHLIPINLCNENVIDWADENSCAGFWRSPLEENSWNEAYRHDINIVSTTTLKTISLTNFAIFRWQIVLNTIKVMSNGDPSKNDIVLITYVTLTTCEKCYGICCDLLLFNIFLFSFLDAIVYPWLLLGRWKAWWHHRDCRPSCKLVNFFCLY